jgi:hypothetical protein
VRAHYNGGRTEANYHHPHLLYLSISTYIYLSYQGGGDYRGVYDIGFKRGFMGYIGLLLSAPYKIDRMMGCVCGYLSSNSCLFLPLWF